MIFNKPQADEYDEIFELLWMAGGEVMADYIDCEDKSKAKTIFKPFFDDENCQFYYENCIAAYENGEICGAVLSYNSKNSKRYADFFTKLYNKKVEPELDAGFWYIDSIAVFEKYRGRGIAKSLLKQCIIKADDAGLTASLIVSCDKEKARRLYEVCGFKAGERICLAGHEYYRMFR